MRTVPSVSVSSSASPLDSARPGTLHLQNHLRLRIDLRGRVDNFAADGAISVVDKTGSQSGVALDNHAMPRARKQRDDFRHERDAPLSARNLSRDAYQHAVALLAVMYAQ